MTTKKTDPDTVTPKNPNVIEALGMDAFMIAGLVKEVANQYKIPLNAALRVVDLSVSVRLAFMQQRNLPPMPWNMSEAPTDEETQV